MRVPASGRRIALLSVAGPLVLGGLLPTPTDVFDRWCWAGAFVYPVGETYRLSSGSWRATPPFQIIRGFSEPDNARRHLGADLSNGRSGDLVRAAAHGIVVLAAQRDSLSDFGSHVVLAHRLPDGTLAYSVYAHLVPGSIRVREGQRVWLSQPLGRVGRSGNATGPHLHFEVRRPQDLEERWEHTRAVDPLAFLAAWLPGHRADTSRAGQILLWAEEAALIGPRDEGGQPLSRAAWWQMLARAARHSVRDLSARPESLRLQLIDESVLPLRAESGTEERVRWKEVTRDVRRLRVLGVRLPPPPLPAAVHRLECERLFGGPRPLERLRVIARATVPVVRADACLLLADLALPDSLRAPAAPARTRRRPPGPMPAGTPHAPAPPARPGR